MFAAQVGGMAGFLLGAWRDDMPLRVAEDGKSG
jgi:hypothetical protein